MENNEQYDFNEVVEAVINAAVTSVENSGGSVSTKDISKVIESGTINLIQSVFNQKELSTFKNQFKDKILTPFIGVLKKKINGLDKKIVLNIDEDIKKIFHINKTGIISLQEEVKDVLSDAINSKTLKDKISDGLNDNLKFKKAEINLNDIDTKSFSNLFKFSKTHINEVQAELSASLKGDVIPLFIKQFGKAISSKIKDVKISDFIGKAPKISDSGDILKNIITEVSKKKVVFGDEKTPNEIDISSLLGFDKKLMGVYNLKYQTLMFSLLGKIKSGLKDLTFKATDKDGKEIKKNTLTLDISTLLNLPQQLSLYTKIQYNDLIRTFFMFLKKQLSNVSFYNTDENGKRLLSDTLTFDLSSLFQAGNTSVLMKKQYVDVIKYFAKTIQKQIDKINVIPKEIDLTNILSESKLNIKDTEVKTKTTSIDVKEKSGIIEKITKYFENQETKKEDVFERKPEFMLTDISDEGVKKLSKIFGKKDDRITKKEDKLPKDNWLNKINLPTWFKTLGMIGVALATGGIGLLFKGLLDSGPLKGMEKFLGRSLIAAGRQIINFAGKHLSGIFGKMFESIIKVGGGVALKEGAEVAGKGLGKGVFKRLAATLTAKLGKSVLMKIPGLGALIGLGFGISRIIKGDIVGGLLDIASGFVSIVPGVGTAISLAIDAYSVVRDIKGGGSEKLGKSSANLKIQDFINEWLIKIPFVDCIIRISRAFGAFSNKDWKTGLEELAFAIPGAGLMVEAANWVGKKFGTKDNLIDQPGEERAKEQSKEKSINDMTAEEMWVERQKKVKAQSKQPKEVHDYKAFINPKGESVKFDPKDFIKIEASKTPSTVSLKEYDDLKKLFTEIRDILKQSGVGILGVDNKMGELNKTSKTGFKDIKEKKSLMFPPSNASMPSQVQLANSANRFRGSLNLAY